MLAGDKRARTVILFVCWEFGGSLPKQAAKAGQFFLRCVIFLRDRSSEIASFFVRGETNR